MIAALFIGISLALIALFWPVRNDPMEFLLESEDSRNQKGHLKALNIRTLTDTPLKAQLTVELQNIKARIGDYLWLKLCGFLLACGLTFAAIEYTLTPDISPLALFSLIILILALIALRGLRFYEKKQFEMSFPDALNLLSGAVSSGEGLMQAIIFVGDSMEGMVGKEFKLMGQRLSVGQSPEDVLNQSCVRFPYPSFYFFAIALRANISRGGKLKEIIKRLNLVMFNNRSLEKKKRAITAEARTSAWIVACIPVIFMFTMQYLNPDSFDFIMHDDEGRPVLYYTIISETVGFASIYLLMRWVRS
ncbi:type II secretion system F family protein [Endozoicomonadaceae bacterium StTr2]